MSNDLKVTVTVLIGAIAVLAQTFFKFDIPAEVQTSFVVVICAIWGWLTNKKDKPSTP